MNLIEPLKDPVVERPKLMSPPPAAWLYMSTSPGLVVEPLLVTGLPVTVIGALMLIDAPALSVQVCWLDQETALFTEMLPSDVLVDTSAVASAVWIAAAVDESTVMSTGSITQRPACP